MPVRSIAQLKAWFKRGAYPMELHFSDLIDSFFHKDGLVPISSVENLPEQLNGKYNKSEGDALNENVNGIAREIKAAQQDIDSAFGQIEDNRGEIEGVGVRLSNVVADIAKVRDMIRSGVTLDEAKAALTALGDNYKDLYAVANTLKTFLQSSDTADITINTWQEIERFLQGVTDTESLTALLLDIENKITAAYKDAIQSSDKQILRYFTRQDLIPAINYVLDPNDAQTGENILPGWKLSRPLPEGEALKLSLTVTASATFSAALQFQKNYGAWETGQTFVIDEGTHTYDIDVSLPSSGVMTAVTVYSPGQTVTVKDLYLRDESATDSFATRREYQYLDGVLSSTSTVAWRAEAMAKMPIGHRNLALDSGKPHVDSTDYLIANFSLTQDLVQGQKYTLVVKGKAAGSQSLSLYMNDGAAALGSLPKTDDVNYLVFTAEAPRDDAWKRKIGIYNYPSATAAANPATVEWVALYEGEVKPPLDWMPAPEEMGGSGGGVTDQHIVDVVASSIPNVFATETSKRELAEIVKSETVMNAINEGVALSDEAILKPVRENMNSILKSDVTGILLRQEFDTVMGTDFLSVVKGHGFNDFTAAFNYMITGFGGTK